MGNGVFLFGGGFGKGFADFVAVKQAVVTETVCSYLGVQYFAVNTSFGGDKSTVGVQQGNGGGEVRFAVGFVL